MSGPRRPPGPSARRGRAAALLAVAVAAAASERPAAAQDAFEIQVYESDTAAPRESGLEFHYNTNIIGRKQADEDGRPPTHHVTHLTLEPHLGLTPWAEVGFYVQSAVRPDGQFDYAGVKVRFKARLPRRYSGFGFALNLEVSSIPSAYENPWGSEVRPVIDVHAGRFYASINPIVTLDLSGPLALRPQLEPCARVLVGVGGGVDLGAEYYAALGPISAIDPPARQVHRLFAVLERAFPVGRVTFTAHLGAGYGLAAGEQFIAKAILGVDFARGALPAPPPSGEARRSLPPTARGPRETEAETSTATLDEQRRD